MAKNKLRARAYLFIDARVIKILITHLDIRINFIQYFFSTSIQNPCLFYRPQFTISKLIQKYFMHCTRNEVFH